MFNKTSTLSILSGLLLAAACASSAAAETPDGGVELRTTQRAAADSVDAAPAKLTITGLDHAFRTHVELARADASSVRITLPAGLYAIDGAASLNDGDVIPTLSAPRLVVVAAGHVTTVNVSVDVERFADTSAELAGLDAGER